MARLFDDGSNEYLEYGGAVVSNPPLTLAAWINSDDLTIDQSILSIGRSAGGNAFYDIRLKGTAQDDNIQATCYDGTLQLASATDGPSINAWHHACGVFSAVDSRAAYLDGANKGTNSDNCSPASLDATNIAMTYFGGVSAQEFSGSIAEAAIWNAALTDAEVAVLAAGYSPLFVRPQSLIAYWPLIRDEDQDRVGGYDLTDNNGPSIGTHPPVIYPAMPIVGLGSIITGEVCWGHITGVLEENIETFTGNWTGTGSIEGAGDGETICLHEGEEMISEVVDTGTYTVTLLQNNYAVGDDVTLSYRHGATQAACEAAGWNAYVAPFVSLGYVQAKVND